MSPKKQIAVVGQQLDLLKLQQLCSILNLEVAFQVDTIKALYTMVTSIAAPIDLIIIDIARLYEADKYNISDIVRTLAVLLRCHTKGYDNTEIAQKLETAIAIAATLPFDNTAVKEVLTSGDVRGIYPAGEGFTLNEKQQALEEFLSGQCHVPAKIHQALYPKRSVKHDRAQTLTTRQQQILTLVTTRGASNKAIAKILNITDSTVKLHMTSILKKCGVRSRTQLAAFARDHNV